MTAWLTLEVSPFTDDLFSLYTHKSASKRKDPKKKEGSFAAGINIETGRTTSG